jgi:adenosylhomocysteine/aminodeoxyfutalosine nucleosidase
MKIAILGAMEEEIKPLLEVFGEYQEIKYANNIFYTTQYKNLELVIAYSKIGKVFSTLTATIMIEKFGCEKLLFSGVAGGINSDLKIGDLIIATQLCQHDVDITAFGHPFGFIPESSQFIDSDKDLISISKDVAKDMNINIKEGIIATGDQFVASADKKIFIRDTFKADALEMEGGSVAVVCANLNIPFFILRAISDSADDTADMDFDKFLEKSAKISANFLVKMLDKIED